VFLTQHSVVTASRRPVSLFLSSDTGVLYLISLPAVTTPHHTTSAPRGTLNYNKLTLLARALLQTVNGKKHKVSDTPSRKLVNSSAIKTTWTVKFSVSPTYFMKILFSAYKVSWKRESHPYPHISIFYFIVCVASCAVFCLRVVCYFVWHVYCCMLCLILVPLSLGKCPFSVQLKVNVKK
jgi:hypothetical protein